MCPKAVTGPKVYTVLYVPRQAAHNDDWGNRDCVRDRGARERNKGVAASICAHNAQNFYWQ